MIEVLLQAESALALGLLDRAETLYRQVASADPRNSIAVVGLARVTLERRDEAGALTLARQALAIDPQNSAAQRMVERMEEVLRFRGDVVPAHGAAAEPESAGAEPEPAAEPESAGAEPESAAPVRQRSLLDRLRRRR